jgi:hypothetical protein
MKLIKKSLNSKVYKVISNARRIKLILLVNSEVPLVKAAKQLGINYSTAKTIMRVFRNRNRIFNSNPMEKLKIFHIFHGEKKKLKKSTSSVSCSTEYDQNHIQKVKKTDNFQTFIDKALNEIGYLTQRRNDLFIKISKNQKILNFLFFLLTTKTYLN